MFLTKQEQQRKKFLYDHTGVFAVKYNGSTFFYRKDALGNVVKILDNMGNTVVKYKYDAWWGLHWAYGKGIPVLSDLAESARVASVEVNDPTYDLYHDKEFGWLRMIFYLIEGVLGL